MFCIVENVSTIYEVLAKAAKVNTHFKVYNHDNILPRWHANNTQRLGPILAVADIGYAFQDMYTTAKWYEKVYNVTCKLKTEEKQFGFVLIILLYAHLSSCLFVIFDK